MNINDTILYKTEKLLEVSTNGLYKWQNDALDIILNNDAVLIAPPNSGKSYVAYNWANIDNPSNRIIITCPTKAKVNDYVTELRNSGYDVGISTGDAKNNTDASIIICTQEIYNIFYAKCPDQKVIIDEFHFALNDSREYYYNNSYDLNLCLEIKRLFNEYNYNCINCQIDLSGIDLKIHELDMSVSNFTDTLDIIDEYFTESTN